MVRVAYVTAESCGLGHAVRGRALVQAAGRRSGLELRAFGPPVDGAPAGYEGSTDWRERVAAFRPELLLGDISWLRLDELRASLRVPAWLLLRWMPRGYLEPRGPLTPAGWERRLALEVIAVQDGTTELLPPLVVDWPAFVPRAGQLLRAGYNTFWEAVRFGWVTDVLWTDEGSPERRARLDLLRRMDRDMPCNGADELVGMIA